MLRILINAYACGPNRGSEPGMAWNWCLHLAKYCELHIITEGEFRKEIENVLPSLPQGKNMHFYYLPVSKRVRKMCWNQGDWRYYLYYALWQKRAFKQAKDILNLESIDIIHHLNMTGFREPGLLWEIPDIPYIWGPISAKDRFPISYLDGTGFRSKAFIHIKFIISRLQLAYSRKVHNAAKRACTIIAASSDSAKGLTRYIDCQPIVINESGCSMSMGYIPKRKTDGTLHLLWVGRYIFTKQLGMALRTLAALKTKDVCLHIVGGSLEEEMPYKTIAQELGIEDLCQWHEKISHAEVQTLMQQSDLFFFTSVAEGTPHVVLEAFANSLPVLCFDTCGHGDCVDSTVGIKIPLSTPKQSVKEFAEKIDYLYHHREELQRMSEGCRAKQRELSWERKAEQMVEIYHKAIAQHEAK